MEKVNKTVQTMLATLPNIQQLKSDQEECLNHKYLNIIRVSKYRHFLCFISGWQPSRPSDNRSFDDCSGRLWEVWSGFHHHPGPSHWRNVSCYVWHDCSCGDFQPSGKHIKCFCLCFTDALQADSTLYWLWGGWMFMHTTQKFLKEKKHHHFPPPNFICFKNFFHLIDKMYFVFRPELSLGINKWTPLFRAMFTITIHPIRMSFNYFAKDRQQVKSRFCISHFSNNVFQSALCDKNIILLPIMKQAATLKFVKCHRQE